MPVLGDGKGGEGNKLGDYDREGECGGGPGN